MALVRWALRRPQPALPPGRALTRPVHSGFEVRPVHYTLQLYRPVPTVEIELLAINYLTHPLSLRDVKIMRFTAGGIPVAFDNIPLAHEVTVEPHSCFLISCARPLVESETRVATENAQHGFGGAVNITAHGIVKGKEVSYSAMALAINGRTMLR